MDRRGFLGAWPTLEDQLHSELRRLRYAVIILGAILVIDVGLLVRLLVKTVLR